MSFKSNVATKYQIYNSLFLSLPFKGIYRTGTLLPLFAQSGKDGLAKSKTPLDIIGSFFKEYLEGADEKEQLSMLFQFVQYVERQVVLFDAVEDAAFDDTHDIGGKGSVKYLLQRTDSEALKTQLLEKLQDYSVRLTLTAHPTQFYPGKVLGIINDLSGGIKTGDVEGINLLLSQLGKTGFVNRNKPTPYDEAVSLGWFLENVFYNALPQIVFNLLTSLKIDATTFENPRLLTIGFWPGSDRDGNPFVTADITRKVAARMRESILRCHYREIRQVRRRLTFSGVEEIIFGAEQKLYNTLYNPKETVYKSCAELIAELLAARSILIEQHDSLFLELLDLFILKIRMFGFHFSSLDIRQDSRKHGLVWQDILQHLANQVPVFSLENYEKWEETKKIDFLLSLQSKLDENHYTDEFTKETLRSIDIISDIQKQNGAAGCHRYIISNCQSALHITEVFAMTRLVMNNGKTKAHHPLDISPLFETIDDLKIAGEVMQTMYENPQYRAHVKARGNIQHIMLGFSDGTKDGGYLRANWSIYRAKENLTTVGRAFGIQTIFFDGRGGPPGRGGGNNADFYASLGKTIENKEIHITVQGQTIGSNYGTVPTAMFNIERLFTAGIHNHLFQVRNKELDEADKVLLDELADAAYNAYLEIKNDEKFTVYLEKMTPLKWFGDTNIASRPTRRKMEGALRLEDLRAIPFVGAWAQMKQNIPGFYGLGSAVEDLKKAKKGKKVKELYRSSLFFRTLVENSMQSLSKSNFELTRYISKDAEFGKFWEKMYAEYARTLAVIQDLEGTQDDAMQNLATKGSIEMREEIVLPLIVIQQYALQRLHIEKDEAIAEILRKLVLRSMFGIINAARNAA